MTHKHGCVIVLPDCPPWICKVNACINAISGKGGMGKTSALCIPFPHPSKYFVKVDRPALLPLALRFSRNTRPNAFPPRHTSAFPPTHPDPPQRTYPALIVYTIPLCAPFLGRRGGRNTSAELDQTSHGHAPPTTFVSQGASFRLNNDSWGRKGTHTQSSC